MESNFHTISLDAAFRAKARESADIKLDRGQNLNIGHIPLKGRGNALLIGSIGEVALVEYLQTVNDYCFPVYTPDDPTKPEEADVIAGGHRIDVKTREGRYPPSPDYWMFVERSSARHDTDYFVFSWYDRINKTVSLLGYLERELLLRKATLHLAGTKLDNGWTISCDSYGMRIRELEDIDTLPTLLRENGCVRGFAGVKA